MRPSTLTFRYGDSRLACGRSCLIMGILNVTPDSFSDGGEFVAVEQAVRHGIDMAASGADIIDVGGESTRPGARPVSAPEEIDRVVPVIRALAESIQVPISIDTMKAETAEAALAAGARMVNDVSGLNADPEMATVLKSARAGCILMHMRGTPGTMRQFTDYADVVADLTTELSSRLEAAVRSSGLDPEFFMLDPGIGFAKTAEQNLDLIAAIAHFRNLGRPILMGPSRKSFIGHLLHRDHPRERLWGTAGAVAACVLCGADAVRVHDVPEMRDVIRVAEAIRQRR